MTAIKVSRGRHIKMSDLYNNRIDQLRNDLIKKLNEEWSVKWAEAHGNESFDFLELKSQNAFLEDLLEDIENELKKKIGLENTAEILISRDSLRRIFKQDKQSAWQEKTKNTIAYYVGYDGWNDFMDKQPPDTFQAEKEFFSSVNSLFEKLRFLFSPNQTYLAAGFVFFMLVFALIYYLYDRKIFRQNESFLVLANTVGIGYPANVLINYEIKPMTKTGKAAIQISNENLQYSKKPYYVPLSLDKKNIKLSFFTPGLKRLDLRINDKKEKAYKFLVTTNGQWYGCARVKYLQVPVNMENDLESAWYGSTSATENTSDNYLTTPLQWNNYISLKNNRAIYPNGILDLPAEVFKNSEKANLVSRIAFLKSDQFPIDQDSLSLSFRARRKKVLEEDCLTFMLQLTDEDFDKFEFYSSNSCAPVNISIVNNYSKSIPFFDLSNTLNDIFMDDEWHQLEFLFKNGKIIIYHNGEKIYTKPYKHHFKQLREIWLVFEGNGEVDDVCVKNSITQNVLFFDDFNSLKSSIN